MPKKPEQVVYDGLSQVAHAIRRSTALTVAMNILPPESSVDDLKEMADDLAGWLRGSATEPTPTRREPLGEPFYAEPEPYSEG